MKPLLRRMWTAALAACPHARRGGEAPRGPPPPPPAKPAPPRAPPTQEIAQKVPATIPVPSDSIYFDFDKAELKPEAQNELATLGTLLAKNPSLTVRIEGNCDERGTEEYNIALGQRRADAAKKYLVNMGAASGQITAISYGKSRPRALGHDEESWRQHRRHDFVPSRPTLPH